MERRRPRRPASDLTHPAAALMIGALHLTVDDQPAVAMTPVAGSIGLWTADVDRQGDGRHWLAVTAVSSTWKSDTDTIEIEVSMTVQAHRKTLKPKPGDHVHSIGAWPERGLLGTQLGPNKNGTIKW